MYDRCRAVEVVEFLKDIDAVESVTVKETRVDGSRGTAHVVLKTGQRFYIAINAERGVDIP